MKEDIHTLLYHEVLTHCIEHVNTISKSTLLTSNQFKPSRNVAQT